MLLAATAGPLAEAQIRVRVDEVVVPFTVRDENGRLIPGLTREDFTVLEDGKIQTVTEFSEDPVALSAAVVIDSGLKRESLEAIQASIPSLVEAFSPFDEVAVYRFDNEVFQLLDFEDEPVTLDKDRLREALDRLRDLEPTIQFSEATGNRLPPPTPVINGIPVTPRANVPLSRDRRVLHDAIYAAARDLAFRAEDRRRVIIVVTDGTEKDSEIDPEEVRLALLDAEVQVYPIGINVELLVRFTDSLDRYADLTGGSLHYTDGARLQRTYSEITTQARNQYVVTYSSNNPIPEDRIPFREIEIRGDPRYTITHRAGYFQSP